jgi:hypothetical protein
MEPPLPALTLAFSLVGTSRRADRQSDHWSRCKGLAAVSIPLATSVRVLLAVVVFLAPIFCGAATSWAETSSRSWIETLERSFGPGWLQAIIALPTGGYALAGRRGPQPKSDAKAIPKASVIRLDERGEVAWETTVDGRRLDLFGGLSLTPGGQLVLTGFGDNGTDWVLAINPSGLSASQVLRKMWRGFSAVTACPVGRAYGSHGVPGQQLGPSWLPINSVQNLVR